MLREWHQRVLGPQAAHGHLQAGLIGLMAGMVLGLAGVALYLAGEAWGGQAVLEWRKAGIAMAALAPPLIFGGICLALPAALGLRIVAGLGAAVNAAAVGLFLAHYPERFNASALGADRAPMDAAIYAAGSALLIAALLAQIVGVYVKGRGQPDGDTWLADDYDVPDWVVEKDIDDAMARHAVEWGAGSPKGSVIHLNLPGFGEGAVVRGQGAARRASLKVPELESKSNKLRTMSAASIEVPAEGMLDATQALGELRRLQAANPRRYRPPRRPWWRRLW